MEKPETYKFHPESLLQNMVEFMARLTEGGGSFCAALAEERDFSAPILRAALARLSGLPSCEYGLLQRVEALISQVPSPRLPSSALPRHFLKVPAAQ